MASIGHNEIIAVYANIVWMFTTLKVIEGKVISKSDHSDFTHVTVYKVG